MRSDRSPRNRCILSKFYIKPQRIRGVIAASCVVSYRNSTSNHNYTPASCSRGCVVSYRNSTSNHNNLRGADLREAVVSYRNSTSNHNWLFIRPQTFLLYLIEILHQTTTTMMRRCHTESCILSKFYIKPQRTSEELPIEQSCILSKFYIKPQPDSTIQPLAGVVSYRNSTSNHNNWAHTPYARRVVSYRNSTSNHNIAFNTQLGRPVVSYRNSTSNHNFISLTMRELYVVSYRNSTSNHNQSKFSTFSVVLYLIEILHQTTTVDGIVSQIDLVVSYRNSTSNHNS